MTRTRSRRSRSSSAESNGPRKRPHTETSPEGGDPDITEIQQPLASQADTLQKKNKKKFEEKYDTKKFSDQDILSKSLILGFIIS